MEYRIPNEYITDDFIKIAEEMEGLYCQIKWKGGKSYSDFDLQTPVEELWEYLDDGSMEDTKGNEKIIEDLEELETKLIDEGHKIANNIIKAKQKIPIYLDPDVEEYMEADFEAEEIKFDDLTIEQKIKKYFEHFGAITISFVLNPYLILEKDVDIDEEQGSACLDKDYYDVSIAK
jgi:hypothetical protein